MSLRAVMAPHMKNRVVTTASGKASRRAPGCAPANGAGGWLCMVGSEKRPARGGPRGETARGRNLEGRVQLDGNVAEGVARRGPGGGLDGRRRVRGAGVEVAQLDRAVGQV